MTEGNDTQDQGQSEPVETVETLREKLAAMAGERDTLRRANDKNRTEAENRRKEIERRDAEAESRRKAGLPEPERLQQQLNEEREARTRAEQERDSERNGRKADRTDRLILAGAVGASSPLAPAFADLASSLIDRTFLEIDDDGKVTKGLDRALEDLAKRRPEMAKVKPKDPGSGPPRTNRNQNGSTDSRDPFERSMHPKQTQTQ